jgi:hypothetical protein
MTIVELANRLDELCEHLGKDTEVEVLDSPIGTEPFGIHEIRAIFSTQPGSNNQCFIVLEGEV